jgi:hypothetical protein
VAKEAALVLVTKPGRAPKSGNHSLVWPRPFDAHAGDARTGATGAARAFVASSARNLPMGKRDYLGAVPRFSSADRPIEAVNCLNEIQLFAFVGQQAFGSIICP